MQIPMFAIKQEQESAIRISRSNDHCFSCALQYWELNITVLLRYERKPRGLTFLELLHLYSSCSPTTDGLIKSREYVGLETNDALEGKKKTGLDTKYQVAFDLYDFDGDGVLRRDDLQKTLCCVVSWPYDQKRDKGRLAGWPMPYHTAGSALERFEVEERETTDQLTGKSLEDKLLDEIFEECGAIDKTITFNQFKKLVSLYPSFAINLAMNVSASLSADDVTREYSEETKAVDDDEWGDWPWDGFKTDAFTGAPVDGISSAYLHRARSSKFLRDLATSNRESASDSSRTESVRSSESASQP
eukprot:SAG31_NODE_9187_length_1319_cov_1.853279_2_plen_302_part_00